MSTPQIDAPTELTIPPGVGGISQETYDTLSWWATRGVQAVDDLARDRTLIAVARQLCPLPTLERWCSLGSSCSGYLVYHELADPEKSVPVSYDPAQPNWYEWERLGLSGQPIQIGAFWYRSNQMFATDRGNPLDAEHWYQLIDQPDTLVTGIKRIITVEEFQDIQAAAAGPV